MVESYKRKTLFVKRGFQGKLILSTFLFFCGGCLLFFVLLALFSTDIFIASNAGSTHYFGQAQFTAITRILAANWIPLIIGGAMLVVSSIFLSHRVAGPLYRFERVLDSMLNGNLGNRVQLREKDEGKELAAKINAFNATLSQSVNTLNLSTKALDTLLEQVESMHLQQEEMESLASLCWSMKEHNRRIREAFCIYNPKSP